MGRFRLEFDAAGYQRVKEPGLDYLIDGPELLAKFAGDVDAATERTRNFWNPPGTPWLMCRPRQFAPNWYQDARLSDHVLRASTWQWAAGITPVEYEPSRVPGTSSAANQWISVSVPTGTASLDTRNYTAMLAEAGLTLPAPGLVTIGGCSKTPAGDSFSTGGGAVSPFLQWLAYPAPNDVFCFGFAQVAVICWRDSYWVLKTSDSGGQDWELLGKRAMVGGAASSFASATPTQTGGSLVQSVAARPDVRSLLAHVLGFNEIYVAPSVGDGAAFELRHTPDGLSEPLLTGGGFWVAAVPGRLVSFQAQIVGFEEADSREPSGVDDPAPTPWIDLSEHYKPSAPPKFNGSMVVLGTPGASATLTVDNNWETLTPDGFDNFITYGLMDQTGEPWDFAAAETYSGGLFLRLKPGWKDDHAGAFISPQLRCLEFRFPVVLEPRPCSPLFLDDTQFSSVEAEAFRRDPLGKRVRIALFDAGLKVLSDSGHDSRGGYPIHLWEDVDNDGEYETLRVACWVDEFTITELLAEHPNTGEPVRAYQIEARGLLSRLSQPWAYLPQMVNPESTPPGTVEHTFAVSTSLHQTGFDITDPAIYSEQVDPYAGTDRAQLPGTWGRTSGVLGRALGNEWGPSWTEDRIAYLLRITRKLSGWVLYEGLDGRIHYHEDLLLDIQRGAEYSVSAALYATTAEAVSAGVPRQKYLANARLSNEEPKANVVRVACHEESAAITPQVMERDLLSLDDVTYPHFLGEQRIHEEHPREAVDLETARVICRLMVQHICRRRFRWQTETAIAPWEALPAPLSLADVAQLGSRGNFIVDHLSWRLLKSHPTAAKHRTTFTLLSLPPGAVEGTGTGTYPGRAAVVT